MEDLQARHREMAYKVWCEKGQNLVKTVKALSRNHGFDISRQSLAKWRDDYNWERRAAAEQAEELERNEAMSDTSIINSLVRRRKSYEDYLESLPPGKVDNQAQYAFNSVLKTLIDVRKETGQFKVDEFGGFFRDLIEFLRKEDPQAVEVVAKNFDAFSGYIRSKYAG